MAQAKKTTKKTAGTRKKTGNTRKASRRKKELERRRVFRNNVIMITIFVISLLLLLSMGGIGGAAARYFRNLLLGAFGFLAYFFPFFLFGLSVYIYVAKRGGDTAVRLSAICVLFLFLCLFAELVSGSYKIDPSFPSLVRHSQEAKLGGGACGAGLEILFRGAFGFAGAMVIDLAVLILCLVVLTGKSFVDTVGRHTAQAYRKTKENVSRKREEHRKELEEKKNLRMNHVVDGVSRDTKILDPGSLSDTKIEGTTHVKSLNSLLHAESPSGSLGKRPNWNVLHGVSEEPQADGSFGSFAGQSSQDAAKPDTAEAPYHTDAADAWDAAGAAQGNGSDASWPVQENSGQESPYAEESPDADAFYNYGGDGTAGSQPSYYDEPKEAGSQLSYYDETGTADGQPSFEDPGTDNGQAYSDNAGLENDQPYNDEAGIEDEEHPCDEAGNNGLAAGASAAMVASARMAEDADGKEGSGNVVRPYQFPDIDFLNKPASPSFGQDDNASQNQAKLQKTLQSFGVNVKVNGFQRGPSVTRYEILPAPGVKVSKIVSLQDDLKLTLAAPDIRIEAPIPGKSAIGIEVPNKNRVTVTLRELIDTDAFRNQKSKIAFAAGKDINGNVVIADIQKMPHLLIAGATGSGKSVCINSIIMSILYHARPDEVKMIMVDPKVVELSMYNGIPHLLTPVVTDPKKAAGALNWAVAEMTRRYKLFASENVKEIKSYNHKAQKSNHENGVLMEILPMIVIVVDELADLMMTTAHEVEDSIVHIAQLGRAAGIHLVIATQRPSVNVITGLIKANMPSRIAFAVSSGTDSRTILDMNGAEKLLGNGDMLYYPQGLTKPRRVQGAFVSDEEVGRVVNFLKDSNEKPDYNESISQQEHQSSSFGSSQEEEQQDDRDELFEAAGRFLITSQKGSIGSLQRKFRIGFNRAARIVDQLEEAGVLGPEEGTKPRQVLMTIEEFESYIAQS